MPEISQWELALTTFAPLARPVSVGSIEVGNGGLTLMAGPCAIESESLCMTVAENLVKTCSDLKIPYIFKASFDKANRTAAESFRGHGLENGLKVLAKVKEQFGVPVLTDIHETHQAKPLADVVDVLQIPAFLCRQTDLLVACGETGQAVNIKKGQFLHPDDMGFAAEKVATSGNPKIMLTERGALFGYRDLVVDMRGLVIMRSHGYPVIFDATHSVQQMGGAGGASAGLPAFIPAQVRGAAAVGIDGLFIETHPDPQNALSDGATMVPLKHMKAVLEMALQAHSIHQQSIT